MAAAGTAAVLLAVALLQGAPLLAHASIVSSFSGKVTSVSPQENAFSAEVRLVYGVGEQRAIGTILPIGKVVRVSVPESAVLTDFRGRSMTLSDVVAGALFKATVQVDTVAGTVTATKIQFSATAPSSTGTLPPSPTTTVGTTTPPPPSVSATAPLERGAIGFAGKV